MPETPKAARAYADYEAMGEERSLAKLVQKYGKKTGYVRQLERWSETHNWQQRLKAYEDEQLALRRKKRQAEIEKMDEEHSLIGRTQLLRAIRLVERHIDSQDTTLSAAVSLMKAAYELERLARGAATSRLEGEVALMVLPKEYINIAPDEEGSEP